MSYDHKSRPESAAKAAVLDLFRTIGVVDASSTIASELQVRGASRRADLVVVTPTLVACEIKSFADNLSRLDHQVKAYAATFPVVYAALATRHLRAARANLPRNCGIIELIGERYVKAKLLRRARHQGWGDPQSQLSLLPTIALRRLLRQSGIHGKRTNRREDLIAAALQVDAKLRLDFLQQYLEEKYSAPSANFQLETKGRTIAAEDIQLLRAWPAQTKRSLVPDDLFFDWLGRQAATEPFGAVPEDVRLGLSQRAA